MSLRLQPQQQLFQGGHELLATKIRQSGLVVGRIQQPPGIQPRPSEARRHQTATDTIEQSY